MSASKFLLERLLKQPRRAKKNAGFTLLELLVAMVLTFLIITPLMSLVISLMTSDRQEQAKVSSQQEIQAALDYIAQDLQQAVYVYDATALSTNSSTAPNTVSGIKDQIPPTSAAPGCSDPSICVPVLAFWKRKYLDRSDTVNGTRIADIADLQIGSDRFVYSLVVYYLIKEPASPNSTWSQVSRIGRFEVNGGIDNPDPTQRPLLPADPGFNKLPDPTTIGGIQARMNRWQKGGDYEKPVLILVDYIDDTPFADLVNAGANQFTPPNNDLGLLSTECSNKFTGNDKDGNPVSSRVPPDITAAPANAGSFYACVNPANAQGQSVVQVFLRGNALPRLSKDRNTWTVGTGNQQTQLANRPVANVRVAVRGLISPEPDPTN